MEKYEENEALRALLSQLQAHEGSKPAAYSSLWEQQLQQTLDEILNREAFSYDPAGDALYRQYQDLYANQGRLAMEDAAGQAAALTGGYGNSYAATAARQAYQGSLSQLSQLLPQLQSMALARYEAEGSAMKDRYSALQQQESGDFNRYQQKFDRWQSQQKNLYDRYTQERNYDYQKKRDETEDSQWQREFDEAERQFNVKRGIRT